MTEADIDFTWDGATIPIVNADSETETGAKMYPILLIMRTGSWKPKHLAFYLHVFGCHSLANTSISLAVDAWTRTTLVLSISIISPAPCMSPPAQCRALLGAPPCCSRVLENSQSTFGEVFVISENGSIVS